MRGATDLNATRSMVNVGAANSVSNHSLPSEGSCNLRQLSERMQSLSVAYGDTAPPADVMERLKQVVSDLMDHAPSSSTPQSSTELEGASWQSLPSALQELVVKKLPPRAQGNFRLIDKASRKLIDDRTKTLRLGAGNADLMPEELNPFLKDGALLAPLGEVARADLTELQYRPRRLAAALEFLIHKAPGLRDLRLPNPGAGDTTLATLSGLISRFPQLESFRVPPRYDALTTSSYSVPEAILESFGQLPHLRSLNHLRLETPDGIRALAKLPNLKDIEAHIPAAEDAHVRALGESIASIASRSPADLIKVSLDLQLTQPISEGVITAFFKSIPDNVNYCVAIKRPEGGAQVSPLWMSLGNAHGAKSTSYLTGVYLFKPDFDAFN